MFECVQVIYVYVVVYSDFKLVNFVFVRGWLKFIDFGIVNVIQIDVMINVYCENMVGIIDYMLFELMMDFNYYVFMLM